MDRFGEIQAFVAVFEQGSFHGAAQKLNISKSAVSKYVLKLEERLGVQLLHRTTRRICVTDIGKVYCEHATKVLRDLSEADRLAVSMQSTVDGSLRMSIANDLGLMFASSAMYSFLSKFPDLNLRMDFRDQYADLISEGYDMAIWIGELEDSSLRARKLADVNYHLVASPVYCETNGRPKAIKDLRQHNLLNASHKSKNAVWNLLTPSGRRQKVPTTSRISVGDNQLLLKACVNGLGIAHLPSFVCSDALQQGLVEKIMPDLPPVTKPIYAVYPPGHFVSQKVRACIDFWLEAFAAKSPDDW